MGSQKTGPLSADSLHTILLTDPYKPLSPNFLSGKPRQAFCAGYTLYNARSHYQQDYFSRKNEDLLTLMRQITSSFKTLESVQSIPYWTESKESYQDEFELFLRKHLPQKTLNLIPDLEPCLKRNGEQNKPGPSAFSAPGVAARDLNVMMLPPNHGVCYHDVQMHYITRAMLCALRDNKIKLQYLSLPGPDFLGQKSDLDAQQRSGIVALSTLMGVVDPTAEKRTGLLLPTLRGLKVLELNVDFRQTLRPSMLPPLKDNNRLRQAIQQMHRLESLSLGAPIHMIGEPDAWSLTDLLLWKKQDYPDPTDDGDDPSGNPPPAGLPGLLNMLMSVPAALAGWHGAAAPTAQTAAPLTQPGAVPPPGSALNQGGAIPTATTASAVPAAYANVLPQILAGGMTSVDAQGNVTQQPFDLTGLNAFLTGAGSGGAKDTNIPATPLVPNPWPNLRYLSLWNIPSHPEEISRLIKTVKASLRTLRLSRVYFTRPDAVVEPEDDPAGVLLNLGLGANTATTADGTPAGLNAAPDTAEDDEPTDVPELIDMPNGGWVSTSTPAAEAPVATPTTSAASAPSLSGSLGPVPFPLPSHQGASAYPNASVEQEGGDQGDTSDKWLSTIELLADELRLSACNINFEDHDEAWLKQRLSKDITKLPVGRVGKTAASYLLNGDGMGYPMYVAQYQSRGTQDEEEDLVKDKRQLPGPNIHICSIWQACPDGRNSSR